MLRKTLSMAMASLVISSSLSAYTASRIYAGVGSNDTVEAGFTLINVPTLTVGDFNFKKIDEDKKLYKGAIFKTFQVVPDEHGVNIGIGIVHSDIYDEAITKPTLSMAYENKWFFIKSYLADAENNGIDVEVPLYRTDEFWFNIAASYNEVQDLEQRNALVKAYFIF